LPAGLRLLGVRGRCLGPTQGGARSQTALDDVRMV
jgi:hypothetical protein